MIDLAYHPHANVFPLLEGDEFETFVADVRAHGLRVPIVRHPDGRILDGRNRYRACLAAGVEPRYTTWDGTPGTEIAYVVSLNLARRHLDESQRAMVAARLANMRQGERTDQPSANLQKVSQSEAADLLNVSTRTVASAREVLDKGAPELVQAVERGQVAVSTAADVAELPKAQQAEIVARGEREILAAAKAIRAERLEERRAERVEKLAQIAVGNTPLVTEVRYPIVYADPPWRYEHVETESRAIENQYPTMDLDAICALPVAACTTDDAVLFLWATSPKLAEALRVVEAWGFSYRTCAVWDKQLAGMGYYFRQQHELLLVATRGTPPTPRPRDRPVSVQRVRRANHSVKPEEFCAVIDRMYPSLRKVELFARTSRPRAKWAAWGNQAVVA